MPPPLTRLVHNNRTSEFVVPPASPFGAPPLTRLVRIGQIFSLPSPDWSYLLHCLPKGLRSVGCRRLYYRLLLLQ
eukprot:690227-Prorocentrum_minimum.AAC.1